MAEVPLCMAVLYIKTHDVGGITMASRKPRGFSSAQPLASQPQKNQYYIYLLLMKNVLLNPIVFCYAH